MGRAAALASCALLVAACGGQKPPSAHFGKPRAAGDRTLIDVRFKSRGVTLAGTLRLPAGPGPHPTIVWVHGGGPETRDKYSRPYTDLLDPRFAVFTYAKRGTGESGGTCCPLDLSLLADDVVAAVDALRQRDEVDKHAIGLFALSQGGWIAPLAATRSHAIGYEVIISGPAVSVGEEGLYSDLTGDDACIATGNPRALSEKLVAEAKPSMFDPRPVLQRLDVPVLWLYGTLDLSQPVVKDLTVLRPLQQSGKDFKIVVFPGVNHGLRVMKPGHCHGTTLAPGFQPTMNKWLREHSG